MKTKIVLISCLITVFSSCSDWLDPEPLSIYTPENVYTDVSGIESALIPLRKSLRKHFYGGTDGNVLNGPSLIVYDYLTSDYGVAGENAQGMAINFDMAVGPNGQAGFFYNWNSSWGPIRDANTIISRIDDVTWTSEDDKNRLLGEAYFHRAYWYYLLTHQYGDVPFISREHTAPKNDFYSHSRTTILKKIQADLEFAVKHLSESILPGQVSKAAGQHLLTKVYLANLEFDKAITTSTEIISNPKYALMTNRFGSVASDNQYNVVWDMHRPENKSLNTNKEGILVGQDKYGYPGVQSTNGTFTMRIFTPWWSHTLWLKDPDGKRACVDTNNNPQLLKLGRGVGMFRPGSYPNYDIWVDCGSDLRHDSEVNWMPTSKILINNPASEYYGQPVDFRYSNPDDSIRAWFPWPYYKIHIPDQIAPARPQGGNSDWYIFRLAETYLLRAEAYCWKDQKSLAAQDVNKVRDRAKAPLITAGDITIDYILDERARELYLEEMRKVELTRIALMMAERGDRGYSLSNFHQSNFWFDRVVNQGKFYNKGVVWESNEYKISPFHVFWPIPQTAIDANSNGRINQNRGYDGADKNVTPLQEITDNQ